MKTLKLKIIFFCSIVALTANSCALASLHAANEPKPNPNEMIFYYDYKPTPTPSESPTPSPTPTPSESPTPSETPSATPTPSVTPSATPTPSVTPSATPTPSVTPSATPTSSAEPSATPTSSIEPSETPLTTSSPETSEESYPEPSTRTLTPRFAPPALTDIPENAVIVEENGVSYTLVPDEFDSEVFYIFDNAGTPLGFINILPGANLSTISIMDNLIPFSFSEIKSNPQTDSGYFAYEYSNLMYVFAALACSLMVLISIRAKIRTNK